MSKGMRFQTFLEVKGEKAHRDAVAMGLQYKGFGYWADPNTGEAKYKTVNDQLVPVEPDVEAEKWRGDSAEEAPGAAGAGPQGGMVQPGADAAPGGPQIGGGMNFQSGLGVDARAPQKKGWDSGPDGDTCVGGQPREELPPDTFVGKTNNLNWTAGPDGNNAMELGEMRRWIAEGDVTDIADILFDNKTNKTNKTGKLTAIARGEDRSKMGKDTYERAIAKVLGDGQQTSRFDPSRNLKVLGHVGRNRTRAKTSETPPTDTDSYNFETDSYDGEGIETPRWVGAGTSRAQDKDSEQVRKMNAAAKDLVKDTNFDLDSLDDLDPVASGVFGEFRIGPNGIGVKRGEIGPGELAALAKMRDNPAFPTLINARFDSPFMDRASGYNNPGDNPGQAREPGQSKYFDAGNYDIDEWSKKFPTAWGKYAMSIAKGESISGVFASLPPEIQQKAIKNFWNARGDLHKAGFSHNDMHGGNVYVDPETGEVSILDLGLAKDDPFSALMEAAGGFDAEEGEDSQLAYHLAGARIPEELRYRMIDKLEEAGETIMDGWDGDMEDEDLVQETMERIGQVLRGGIRMNNETRESILGALPRLRDREFVMPIIERLYEGLTDGLGESQQEEEPEAPAAGGIETLVKKMFDLDDQVDYNRYGWLLYEQFDVSKPDFDMGPLNRGKEFAAGGKAKVFPTLDKKAVIKDGRIGANEMGALNKLKHVSGVPNLINAKVKKQANGDFKGAFAQDLMPGQNLEDASGYNRRDIMNQVINLRKQVHQNGIAHNDMNPGNFRIDNDKVGIIDFGEAQDDYLAAFGEAMGSDGSDMLEATGDFGFEATREAIGLEDDGGLMNKIKTKKQNIRDILDGLDGDNAADLDALMAGGRRGTEHFDAIRERIPWLADDNNVRELIDKFYDGLQVDEPKAGIYDRMSKAVDSGRIPKQHLNLDD